MAAYKFPCFGGHEPSSRAKYNYVGLFGCVEHTPNTHFSQMFVINKVWRHNDITFNDKPVFVYANVPIWGLNEWSFMCACDVFEMYGYYGGCSNNFN